MRRAAFPGLLAPSGITSCLQFEKHKKMMNRLMSKDNRISFSPAHSNRTRIKTVALPVEHGGWGIALEPVALGLIVAPSVAGIGLAVATMGAFLARHPLKLLAADRRNKRRFSRTETAERFVLLYGMTAALGLLIALIAAPDKQFLWPLVATLPLAMVQLISDAKGKGRALWPELAGSVAMAAVATSIALAGGWAWPVAFGLWAVLVARVVPTILYVRARLKLLHGKESAMMPVMAAHIVALALIFWLAWFKAVPMVAAGALIVLLLRAFIGFSTGRPGTAKSIGVSELVFGAMTVLAVALGHLASL